MSFRKILDLHKRSFLTTLLFIAFMWSLFSITWSKDLIHAGGKSTINQIIKAFFNPDFSPEILKIALVSSWITLVYAVVGISLALIIGLVLGILASGILGGQTRLNNIIKTFFRGLLGFMRAIHELVWAWLFVAAIGLSPYAAIFALAIPYGGTLGRVFADLLKDVDNKSIIALRSTGASPLQVLFYGYFQIAFSDMLSYSMYRLECAVRSSTILSFVGLGGIGFQIQLSLGDLRYNEVWTFMFFLIALVMLIDLWSNMMRNGNIKKISLYILGFLFSASWIYIIKVDGADFLGIFSSKNAFYTRKFLGSMIGVNDQNPAFLNLDSWKNALKLSYETLQMSVMSIGFATIGMLISVIPASRNVANGKINLSRKWYSYPLYHLNQGLYIFSRSIPELVWAMILVFILKPGILPGAIALGLHNYGILGKLCSEVIENMDLDPIQNLSSNGANKVQIFLYGVVPTVLPKFITYILYRWEVIIRTTIVVGFVGAGALGQEFKLSMSFLRYTDVTLFLICYLVLVYFADIVSDTSRKIIN